VLLSDTSTPVTSAVPSQLSVQVKFVIAGTSAGHDTVTSAGGALKTGATKSCTVITC